MAAKATEERTMLQADVDVESSKAKVNDSTEMFDPFLNIDQN